MPFRPCKKSLFKPVSRKVNTGGNRTRRARGETSPFSVSSHRQLCRKVTPLAQEGIGPEWLIMSLIHPLCSFGHNLKMQIMSNESGPLTYSPEKMRTR